MKDFLKPTKNSKGLFEKGVGMVELLLVLNENIAKTNPLKSNNASSIKAKLMQSTMRKGIDMIRFSIDRILFLFLSP